MKAPVIGVFYCSCGHSKASHRPHGGRRVPLLGWICRKAGCECVEYGAEKVDVEFFIPHTYLVEVPAKPLGKLTNSKTARDA